MERREISVRGIVQGVGFRPFKHGLASRLGLAGRVQNVDGGVRIEIEGEGEARDLCLTELVGFAPPLARIEDVRSERREPVGETGFRIEWSVRSDAGEVFVSPDAATCADCLRELFDPGDRRYRYPFLNCTACEPESFGPEDEGRMSLSAPVQAAVEPAVELIESLIQKELAHA